MSGITKAIGKAFSRLDGKKVAGAALAAVAGYYLSGGFDTGSDLGADVAPGGGDESAGLNLNPTPTNTNTMDTGGSTDFGGTTPLPMPDTSATDAANAADVPGPGAADSSPTPSYTSPSPAAQADASTISNGGGAPQPQAAAQSQPPAPAGPAAPAPTTSQPTPPVGAPRAPSLSGTMSWLKSLSAPAQAALMGTVAGGAGALMNALSQKHAQEFALEKENRERADFTRRGAVPAFGQNTFTPNGPGIINIARGQ